MRVTENKNSYIEIMEKMFPKLTLFSFVTGNQ